MRDGRGEGLECSYDMMFFLAFFLMGLGCWDQVMRLHWMGNMIRLLGQWSMGSCIIPTSFTCISKYTQSRKGGRHVKKVECSTPDSDLQKLLEAENAGKHDNPQSKGYNTIHDIIQCRPPTLILSKFPKAVGKAAA